MRFLALAGALCIAACSAQQEARFLAAVRVACIVDAAVQPVAVFVAALVPQTAAAAGADQLLVHPAVVAACAAVGGKPAAVAAK